MIEPGNQHRNAALAAVHRIPDRSWPGVRPKGKLIYAGRVGSGMPEPEMERLWRRVPPLLVDKVPLAEPPPRASRFGSPWRCHQAAMHAVQQIRSKSFDKNLAPIITMG
jgi:ATP-dependent DNA ligase